MTDEILPLGLDRFAKGAAEYLDYYPGTEFTEIARIVLQVYLANRAVPMPVIVDTAAPWCVLDPLEFEKIEDYTAYRQTTQYSGNILYRQALQTFHMPACNRWRITGS